MSSRSSRSRSSFEHLLETYDVNDKLCLFRIIANFENEPAAALEFLLENGAAKHILVRDNGQSILHFAINHAKKLGYIETLLKHGATHDILSQSRSISMTPLMIALLKNRPDVAKLLIEYGGADNQDAVNYQGKTALMIAIEMNNYKKSNNADLIPLMLQKNPNLDIKDRPLKYGNAFQYALSYEGDNEIIEAFLEHCGDKYFEEKNPWGATILELVAYRTKDAAEVLKLLLQYDTKNVLLKQKRMKDKNLYTSVITACRYQTKKDFLELILEQDDPALADTCNDFEMNALDMACNFGRNNIEVIEFLLEKGADKYLSVAHNGYTPMIFAARRENGHLIIPLLLKYDKDDTLRYHVISKQNNKYYGNRRSVLMIACQEGTARNIKALFEKEFDSKQLQFVDESGVNALMIACERQKDPAVFDLLIDEKTIAQIDEKTGNNALMYACKYQSDNNAKVIEVLLKKGAWQYMHVKNHEGKTAYDIAEMLYKKKILSVFKEQIAKAAVQTLGRIQKTLQKQEQIEGKDPFDSLPHDLNIKISAMIANMTQEEQQEYDEKVYSRYKQGYISPSKKSVSKSKSSGTVKKTSRS